MGESYLVRALFDTGSEVNLMTEKTARMINVKRERFTIEIIGMAGREMCDSGIVSTSIQSWCDERNNVGTLTKFIVMKQIPFTKEFHFNKNIKEFEELPLADPKFNKSGAIDLLLGIEIWSEIVQEHILHSDCGLRAQRTKFGYVIFGTYKNSELVSANVMNTRAIIDDKNACLLDQLLARFWELNEMETRNLSIEEEYAELHYVENIQRDQTGRFVVRIPFVNEPTKLGESRSIALQRFYQLERRLDRDNDLREKYNNFMKEYIELGHMREATKEERMAGGYYIPHHPVMKRFRVVFDSSCATTNGKSINDIQLAGANLQEHLTSVIMRFRFHRIVLSTDVKKMFRQFRMHPQDVIWQKILWRFSANSPILEYVLLTITYGMKCSPFLAIRCMIELAHFYKNRYPMASRATLLERYVDDYFTGADNEEEIIKLYNELRAMLAEAGLELGKWRTNCPELATIINTDENDECVVLSDEHASVLGLIWIPKNDCFAFKVELSMSEDIKITKLVIVSEVAKLYDPNGYMAPVITVAKALIQKLWVERFEWNELLSEELIASWKQFYYDLIQLNQLRIPRWIQTTRNRNIDLIGFCDASQRAYGAAVYVRCTEQDKVWCNLLISKSRVAPVKTVSIPRLELCAAELLAKLMNQVRTENQLEYASYHMFSDSMIMLHWLKRESATLKTFVANRVATVQRNSDTKLWHHVPTDQNPADILSRGCSASELLTATLWWHGPQFVMESYEKWPNNSVQLSSEQVKECSGEYKATYCVQIAMKTKDWLQINNVPLIERYSSLGKVIRVTAYIYQWLDKYKERSDPNTIGFSNEQLNCALDYWIRYTQLQGYARELSQLNSNGSLNETNKLNKLQPFLDGNGIMRMRGRIKNACVSYDQRHPILIPPHNHFVRLMMREAHEQTDHGNVQDILQYVRAKYWIIQDKRAAQRVVKTCLACIRHDKEDRQQLMGDIPKERLSVAPPFTYCGVDYFGPIKLQRFEGRCNTVIQGYVALFICMTTKMVHMECCTDLTTEKFIMALSRFTSIYRTPVKMFSDNGRTFVGANNELKRIYETWQSTEMRDYLTGNNMQWQFITPRAPNQGGLWEAAVKSAKYHLKRILRLQKFTFERYQTILARVSAVLNSRPLSPLSRDPFDLNYLTPSHAHKGCRVVQPLTRNLSETPNSPLKLQLLMDKIHKDFWNSWRRDYLGTQQNRYKWNIARENLKIGDFVIVKEDNMPPATWSIARIIEVYPGDDEIVRNVKIRTATTDSMRPVRKLVKLPILDEDQEPIQPKNGTSTESGKPIQPMNETSEAIKC